MDKRVVKKFGGTSVGSIEKIEAVADRLQKDIKRGECPIVVISAMSGWTSSLEKMSQEVYPNFKGPAYDMLLSSGEQVSLSLLSLALEKRGVRNTPLLGHQAGIQTDSLFSKACIQSVNPSRLAQLLDKSFTPLVAGFQGVDSESQITTLGRGGSDLTAVALAVALKIKTCEIYTDVLGVFTGDPKLIPKAKIRREIDFSEMMEMSFLGSRVLQIRSVELAGKYGVNIHVRHALKSAPGTWILNKDKEKGGKDMEGPAVSAVAHDLNTQVIRIKNPPSGARFVSDLFNRLGERNVFVDIISQSEVSSTQARLSFSIAKTDLNACMEVLKSLVPERDISLIQNVAKISVTGLGMAGRSGVAGKFFSALQKTGTSLHLVTTSEIKISAIIDEKDLKTTAQALHKEFGLDSSK